MEISHKDCLGVSQNRVEKNFEICGSVSREVTSSESITSIGDLLRYIGKQVSFDFINPASGTLKEDIEVEER